MALTSLLAALLLFLYLSCLIYWCLPCLIFSAWSCCACCWLCHALSFLLLLLLGFGDSFSDVLAFPCLIASHVMSIFVCSVLALCSVLLHYCHCALHMWIVVIEVEPVLLLVSVHCMMTCLILSFLVEVRAQVAQSWFRCLLRSWRPAAEFTVSVRTFLCFQRFIVLVFYSQYLLLLCKQKVWFVLLLWMSPWMLEAETLDVCMASWQCRACCLQCATQHGFVDSKKQAGDWRAQGIWTCWRRVAWAVFIAHT